MSFRAPGSIHIKFDQFSIKNQSNNELQTPGWIHIKCRCLGCPTQKPLNCIGVFLTKLSERSCRTSQASNLALCDHETQSQTVKHKRNHYINWFKWYVSSKYQRNHCINSLNWYVLSKSLKNLRKNWLNLYFIDFRPLSQPIRTAGRSSLQQAKINEIPV